MVRIFSFARRLGLAATASMLIVFAIYWFELDDKFLKAFEPTFRKICTWMKG
ncbi:MAG TPA: hypothetical protein PLT09_09515 [Deltaproteobacteria bacterium]|nr:hypothetical protein [Deltaproteobacteria bacterium]HPR55887.1 hypothetical protein [Deltaproteobacteria bacterium]HXK47668.1 hypothetical protein [Deltaproteobacteria bacterium]